MIEYEDIGKLILIALKKIGRKPKGSYGFSKYQELAVAIIGQEFTDLELLVTAFTHRSYLNEHKKRLSAQRATRILGDAVLELVVTEYLYGNYSEPEGILTNWRSSLVRTERVLAPLVTDLALTNTCVFRAVKNAGANVLCEQILANCLNLLLALST